MIDEWADFDSGDVPPDIPFEDVRITINRVDCYANDTGGAMTMAALKELPQWVGYTAAKVPMNPHTGRAAASNNPATWATADVAWAAKKRHGWAGIGYVFTIAASVVGVDLDDCFIGEGDGRRLTDTARQVVQMLDSYTEVSPSGRGLHILARGSIPNSIKHAGFEMYNELRYFTVTGRQYGRAAVEAGFVSGNIEARQRELAALFVAFGGDYEPRPLPTVPATYSANEPNIAEVQRALAIIPAWGDYNADWLPVLMAVHDAFPDQRGIDLIEAWSPGYKGEVAHKWESFRHAPRDGQRITIATLFHVAKMHGYQPARRPATAPPARRGADITDALARRRNGYA